MWYGRKGIEKVSQPEPNPEDMKLLSFLEFPRVVCCRLHGEIIKALIKSLSISSNGTKNNMEGIVLKPTFAKGFGFLLIPAFPLELYYEVPWVKFSLQ